MACLNPTSGALTGRTFFRNPKSLAHDRHIQHPTHRTAILPVGVHFVVLSTYRFFFSLHSCITGELAWVFPYQCLLGEETFKKREKDRRSNLNGKATNKRNEDLRASPLSTHLGGKVFFVFFFLLFFLS
ncbi:hypothetical protein BO82DRAFT_157640 [Aspergillus uvarum CBS 121591]|uniref:Transmembrane protein n=1 Tax=Aspergillus uvarum CBS 121591 TaxID=1448315 RepID=A0A319BZU0_9EURO|nr:hypothetical protein BO82DRAFT_157640 [Aspergillus uvarum CBS 121591]PYH78305.1 hypothetical protein BO82DRAFT_157640 [Aspergillus uvarum CBS 121591]